RAGRNGESIVRLMIPKAKIVRLPDEVGAGGDVTDFFARLGHSKDDFTKLLQTATTIPTGIFDFKVATETSRKKTHTPDLTASIERIRKELPIEALVCKYVQLVQSPIPRALVGRCPFHNDHTTSFVVCRKTRMY